MVANNKNLDISRELFMKILFMLMVILSSFSYSCDNDIVGHEQKKQIVQVQPNPELVTPKPCQKDLYIDEIFALPDEIFSHILSYSNIDTLLKLEQTHSKFYRIIRGEPALWYNIAISIHKLLIPKFDGVDDYKTFLKGLPLLNFELTEFMIDEDQSVKIYDDGSVKVSDNNSRNPQQYLWKTNEDQFIKCPTDKTYGQSTFHRHRRKTNETIEVTDHDGRVTRLKIKIYKEFHQEGIYSVLICKNEDNLWQILTSNNRQLYKLIVQGLENNFFKISQVNDDGSIVVGQKFVFNDNLLKTTIPFYIHNNEYNEIIPFDNYQATSSYIPVHSHGTLIKFLNNFYKSERYFYYDLVKGKMVYCCKINQKKHPLCSCDDIILGHNEKYHLRIRNVMIYEHDRESHRINTPFVFKQNKEVGPLTKFIDSSDHRFGKLNNIKFTKMHVSPSRQWLVLKGLTQQKDLFIRINLNSRHEFFAK